VGAAVGVGGRRGPVLFPGVTPHAGSMRAHDPWHDARERRGTIAPSPPGCPAPSFARSTAPRT
jgi:hypothetical protein